MKPSEVALVLAKAASFDRRKVDEMDVMAWHEVLGSVELEDALAAVTRHYYDSTEWLMPATLRRLAAKARDERQRRQLAGRHEVLALPSRFEPDVERSVRVAAGVARCRDVLGPVLDELARRRHVRDEGAA